MAKDWSPYPNWFHSEWNCNAVRWGYQRSTDWSILFIAKSCQIYALLLVSSRCFDWRRVHLPFTHPQTSHAFQAKAAPRYMQHDPEWQGKPRVKRECRYFECNRIEWGEKLGKEMKILSPPFCWSGRWIWGWFPNLGNFRGTTKHDWKWWISPSRIPAKTPPKKSDGSSLLPDIPSRELTYPT